MSLVCDRLWYAVLQVHASNGQYETALESCFNAVPDSGGGQVPSAAAGLSAQMEVSDAVLRLVADNAATPSIRCEILHACLPQWGGCI
jgi:hypothetical protein